MQTAVATINQASNQPAIAQKPAKQPRVPKRIVNLIDLLLTGECTSVKAACERIGLDRSYASRQLRKVHVAAYLEHQTRVTLARLQAPAAGLFAKMMVEAQSEHVRKDLVIHALAMQGHKPAANTQVSVSVDIKAGYVIDLTDGAKTIEGTSQRAFSTDTRNESE